MFVVGKEFPDVIVVALISPSLPSALALSCKHLHRQLWVECVSSWCQGDRDIFDDILFIFDGQGFWRPCTPCKNKAVQVGPVLFVLIYRPYFII